MKIRKKTLVTAVVVWPIMVCAVFLLEGGVNRDSLILIGGYTLFVILALLLESIRFKYQLIYSIFYGLICAIAILLRSIIKGDISFIVILFSLLVVGAIFTMFFYIRTDWDRKKDKKEGAEQSKSDS